MNPMALIRQGFQKFCRHSTYASTQLKLLPIRFASTIAPKS